MGKGGMLSAQKKLLEATVAETGAQLQQQELTYYTSNFGNMMTMASVIGGFAFSGIFLFLRLFRFIGVAPVSPPVLLLLQNPRQLGCFFWLLLGLARSGVAALPPPVAPAIVVVAETAENAQKNAGAGFREGSSDHSLAALARFPFLETLESPARDEDVALAARVALSNRRMKGADAAAAATDHTSPSTIAADAAPPTSSAGAPIVARLWSSVASK